MALTCHASRVGWAGAVRIYSKIGSELFFKHALSRWKAMTAVFLVLGLAISISAQVQHSAVWRVFRVPDGMADSLATSIAVCPNGVVWIRHGNADMVSRYDGYEFRTYPAPEGIGRIREDAFGQVWTTCADGFQEWRDGRWEKHRIGLMAAESRTNFTRKLRPAPLLAGRDDQLFVLLRDRVFEYRTRARTVTELRMAETGAIGAFNDFCRDNSGVLWIAGEKGLSQGQWITEGTNGFWRWKDFNVPEALQVQNVVQPIEDAAGGVVAIAELQNSGDRSILYLPPGAAAPTVVATGRYRRAWHQGKDVFWADSLNELVVGGPRGWKAVAAEGIIAGRVHDVAVESSGVFWLATTEGLVRCAPAIWQTSQQADSVHAPVHVLYEDARSRIWGMNAQDLILINQTEVSVFPVFSEVESLFRPTDSIFSLADGRIAASSNDRLWLFTPSWERADEVTSSSGKPVRFLGRYRSGLFCVQIVEPDFSEAGHHLELFNGKRFSTFPDPAPPKELGPDLALLTVTKNGDVWLGSRLGIARYRNLQWQYFDPKSGTAPPSAMVILETRRGDLLCGSETRLYRFNGRTWSLMRSGFDRINNLMEASDDSLWVASGSGLYRYVKGTWMMHGSEEGLPSEAVYDVLEDHQNRIWAGTARGLCLFHPQADIDSPRASVASQKEMSDIDPNGTLTLGFEGHDRWSFTQADRLLFSYRLDDGMWSPYRKVNLSSFDNLAPGRHQVEVKAMDRNWNESLEAASFVFNVRLPWYRETRLLIVSSIGLLIILVLAGLAVNRHLRLVRSYAEVERIVRQRTGELEQAQEALLHSQKMRALGTLAAGIAHDFNSILSIIRGSAQIIESHIDDEERIRTRVNRIKMSVDQGSAIVKALLGYGKAARQESEPIDVNTVVQETIHLLEDRLGDSARIRFEPSALLPPVSVTKDLLQQMLLNMLNNASEAMSGKGEVVLRTGLVSTLPSAMVLLPCPAARHVSITIQDSGCGIPSEIRNRIFEPFFTTKAMSDRKGTGLGLSMVFEFAKDQGCGIRVDSVMGQGSTFTLFLPVKDHSPIVAPPMAPA